MKYGGVERAITNESWESLLRAADNDFVSVLVLWYCGIEFGGTFAWMMPHTVEKYLKSYLLKTKDIRKKELKAFGKSGHSLIEIWNKYKSVRTAQTTKPKLNTAFDDIVNELDSIRPSLRYTCQGVSSSDQFIYFYIVLCSLMRYLIIGKLNYRSSFYGIEEWHFLPMNYHPMCIGYGTIIVQKMLHIALEHAGSFTSGGFINFWEDNYYITNTAIFGKMKDCPICNYSGNDQISIIKCYRNLNPTPISN